MYSSLPGGGQTPSRPRAEARRLRASSTNVNQLSSYLRYTGRSGIGARCGMTIETEAPGVGRSRTTKSDRKSTRLNSSHVKISYAVFCLKKKKDTISSKP